MVDSKNGLLEKSMLIFFLKNIAIPYMYNLVICLGKMNTNMKIWQLLVFFNFFANNKVVSLLYDSDLLSR